MQGFTYEPVSIIGAYVMSCIGSALGLLCTARARDREGLARARWLVLAAFSIGGTGIWVMHFIAMLGSDVANTEIRYDGPLTILSMIVAVVVVAVGLFVVAFNEDSVWPLLLGGAVTGCGVAIMHYLGMAALHLDGMIQYNPLIVAASLLIAVVAATAALWATMKTRGMIAVVGAALIMGVAVSGMHYTGMVAAEVTLHESSSHLPGMTGFDFLLPLLVAVSLVTMITFVIVGLAPDKQELVEEAEIRRRLARFRR